MVSRRRTYAAAAALVFAGSLLSLTAYAQSSFDVTITAEVTSDVEGTVQWAVPQGRVGSAETNDDADFYLTVRTSSDLDDVVVATVPAASLFATGVEGRYLTATNLGVSPGTYDIGFKGSQHLTRVLDDVTLASGPNVLNFSQADNSAPKGSVTLLAGDVNGAGTTPATLGDDVVNSVDISTLLAVVDDDDPSGNALRPNLNQDIVVNSVDLSLMIGNLDAEGDN